MPQKMSSCSARSSRDGRMAQSCRVLLIFVLLLAAMPVCGEDWPMFRHDRELTAATGEKLDLPLDSIWVFRSRQSQHPVAFRGDQAAAA